MDQGTQILYAVIITAAVFSFILIFLFVVIYNYMRSKRLNDAKVFNAVFHTQERERNRIAQEIHDDIGSRISIIKFTNEFILAGKNDPETAGYAKNNSKAIDDLAVQIRDICRNLASDILLRNGLRQEVQKIVDRTQQVANVHIHLLINVEEDILKKEFVLSLYRIIQELINNSVKHSGCSQIQLRVEEESDLLKLQYADDGVGYPYETLESAQGMGLRNISGRVYAHNGRVNLLRTRPGFGILAEFPKKYVCTESADRGRSQSVL